MLLALVAIGLSFGYYLYYCGNNAARRRVFTFLLIACTLPAFYLYLRLGPQFNNVTPEQIMNAHDFYHYYVGSKYSHELGYFELYQCTVLVDSQTTRKMKPNWRYRDLRTYGFLPVSRSTNDPGHCLQRFSHDRWNEFSADVTFLLRQMPPKYLANVMGDKGYNATPVWNRFASVLTNLFSLHNRGSLYAILSLDYLYTLAAFLAVAWAYGWRNSLFVVTFWSLNFMNSFGFDRGSVSRLDWLACLVIAMCLLKRGRYGGAGALAGVATCMRLFPALFFVGLGAKMVWTLIRTRRLPREYVRFIVGGAVSVAALVGMTSLTSLDRERWGDFKEKITSHDKQLAGFRVGLKYALVDPDSPTKSTDHEDAKPIRLAAAAAALLVVFFAAPRLRDHETMALGLALLVVMSAPTFYYYQLLAVPFMLFLPDPRRPGLAIGMATFFAWCVLAYMMGEVWPLGITLSYHLSWSLLYLALIVVALVFFLFPREEPHPVDASAG